MESTLMTNKGRIKRDSVEEFGHRELQTFTPTNSRLDVGGQSNRKIAADDVSHICENLAVEFISITESIDTSTPAGKALFGMIGVFAEFEHDLISERVRAGMARAKKKGVKFGSRPRLMFDREKLKALHAAGKSVREIRDLMKLSIGTIHRTLASA